MFEDLLLSNLPSCFSIEFLEQLLKFLVNFTLLKYVKSQRSYGFLITKELIFGFQILDLKDHFSASLKEKPSVSGSRIFGYQFYVISQIFGYYLSGQNGRLWVIMGRGYPPPNPPPRGPGLLQLLLSLLSLFSYSKALKFACACN